MIVNIFVPGAIKLGTLLMPHRPNCVGYKADIWEHGDIEYQKVRSSLG